MDDPPSHCTTPSTEPSTVQPNQLSLNTTTTATPNNAHQSLPNPRNLSIASSLQNELAYCIDPPEQFQSITTNNNSVPFHDQTFFDQECSNCPECLLEQSLAAALVQSQVVAAIDDAQDVDDDAADYYQCYCDDDDDNDDGSNNSLGDQDDEDEDYSTSTIIFNNVHSPSVAAPSSNVTPLWPCPVTTRSSICTSHSLQNTPTIQSSNGLNGESPQVQLTAQHKIKQQQSATVYSNQNLDCVSRSNSQLQNCSFVSQSGSDMLEPSATATTIAINSACHSDCYPLLSTSTTKRTTKSGLVDSVPGSAAAVLSPSTVSTFPVVVRSSEFDSGQSVVCGSTTNGNHSGEQNILFQSEYSYSSDSQSHATTAESSQQSLVHSRMDPVEFGSQPVHCTTATVASKLTLSNSSCNSNNLNCTPPPNGSKYFVSTNTGSSGSFDHSQTATPSSQLVQPIFYYYTSESSRDGGLQRPLLPKILYKNQHLLPLAAPSHRMFTNSAMNQYNSPETYSCSTSSRDSNILCADADIVALQRCSSLNEGSFKNVHHHHHHQQRAVNNSASILLSPVPPQPVATRSALMYTTPNMAPSHSPSLPVHHHHYVYHSPNSVQAPAPPLPWSHFVFDGHHDDGQRRFSTASLEQYTHSQPAHLQSYASYNPLSHRIKTNLVLNQPGRASSVAGGVRHFTPISNQSAASTLPPRTGNCATDSNGRNNGGSSGSNTSSLRANGKSLGHGVPSTAYHNHSVEQHSSSASCHPPASLNAQQNASNQIAPYKVPVSAGANYHNHPVLPATSSSSTSQTGTENKMLLLYRQQQAKERQQERQRKQDAIDQRLRELRGYEADPQYLIPNSHSKLAELRRATPSLSLDHSGFDSPLSRADFHLIQDKRSCSQWRMTLFVFYWIIWIVFLIGVVIIVAANARPV